MYPTAHLGLALMEERLRRYRPRPHRRLDVHDRHYPGSLR
jgi:hypothetical protein